MVCQDGLSDVLHGAVRKLVSLDLRGVSLAVTDEIVEYCPNLQYLEIFMRRGVYGKAVRGRD
jgi:hypothetical protein